MQLYNINFNQKVMKNTLLTLLFIPVLSFGQLAYNDFNEIDKQHLLVEKFNSSGNWEINNNWIHTKVDNGYYNLQCRNFNNSVGLAHLPFNLDTERNFEVEALIKVKYGSGGLVLGMTPDLIHYRIEIIDDKTLLLVENNPKKQIIKRLVKADISSIYKPGDYNKISFRKVGQESLIFVNGHLVSINKKIELAGKEFGFSVGLNSELEVDEFRISYLRQNNQPEVALNKQDLKSFPLLSVENIAFIDANENNTIEAFEDCALSFNIKNEGKGAGKNVKLHITNPYILQGLDYPKEMIIGEIAPGTFKQVSIPFTSDRQLQTTTASLNINFEEQNGFPPDAFDIQIGIEGYKAPLVKVVDYTFSSDYETLKLGVPLKLKVLVQNIGKGKAEDVNINFVAPTTNFLAISSTNIPIGELSSGESREITFEFIANKRYEASTIPIDIQVKEKTGEYAENSFAEANINDVSRNQTLIISTVNNYNQDANIAIRSLTSDIDKNIPLVAEKKSNRYALIIGNEDYSSYQTGLSSEVNVEYAANDAKIFAEYAMKTLGIPEKQVKLLINATAGQMKQSVAWLQNLAKIEDGDAEIIFYYSGHGLPDENSHQPYLIPVDVSGLNLTQAIKLDDVLEDLTEYPAQKISVFLDACFSGGARNKELIAMKGVRIQPIDAPLRGNLVLFTSSSGSESSGVYYDQKHGFFTYYLLKKLQESQGKTNYGEWADYIRKQVTKQTSLISKPQTPQIQASKQVSEAWENWTAY